MTRAKKFGVGVLAAFIAIQFFRPARNQSNALLPTDIARTVAVPQDVAVILKAACHDCHSNNTVYPWYANVQPSAWYLANHVAEGKRELNFSEFGSYSKRKQANKLKAIAREVEKGAMPLSSYKLMHPSARLSSGQKTQIISWAAAAQDSLRQ